MKSEQARTHIDPIIENALDAVITIDSDGIITSWNKQAETTFGWSRQEALGLRLSDTIIPHQYREAHNQGMRHYLASGEGPVLNNRIEITALHRSGREFPVELTVNPVRIDDSVAFSAFVRDITERKRASEALKESEARAQAVLDTAAEGIITIDEQGVIESFNPAAARIFGYNLDEVTGKNVSMLMPEPYHSHHDGYLANYLSTGQGKIIGIGREIEGRRKDGTIFPIHLAVSEVKLGSRRIFTGIVHDITDLKQAEESLRRLTNELEQRVTERTAQLAQANEELSAEITERKQLESRYRALFEEAPAMYVITENIDDVPYIKDCNQLFATVLGYSRRDILERPLFDFFTVESRTELLDGGYQRALTGEFTVEDRQLTTKDGRVIETLLRARPELDTAGNVVGTRAMFSDITERKQMEAAEREQRALAEALREAALMISTSLDFDTVLDHILEQIARVVPYDGINLMLVEDDRTQTVRLRGYEQFGQDVAQEVASLSFDIRETPNLYRLVETRQPYIIADTAHYPNWQAGGVTGHCRSWAAAPICIRDEVVAFLLLDKIEPDFYQPKDAARLAAFASQAAVAFENARLYQATQHQVKELTALNTIGQAAISTLELDQILNVITNHIFQLLNIEAASVVLKDRDSDQLLFATAAGRGADVIKHRRIAANQGIVGWCIEHGEPALVPDVSADPRFYSQLDQATNHTTRSVLCVPLHIKGQTIGAIEVTNKKDGSFDQYDLQLLSSVAAPVATAIDNAQLYQQTRRHAAELEQRVAERTTELSAANAELARAARLKDEFLASMSH
ncbi:MAG: PAS domain S-box protein, partial [Anaerolineae bacterium]|nr:PAS domain S-box protein [Anaerolineae bacterium]